MPLDSGAKLGPYEIRSLLGQGGMGEVYRARDTRLQRDVAIKVLPHSFAHDPERLRRFEQEAQAIATLSHPNLLTVFDVGTLPVDAGHGAETAPYLVSELLEGATLRERLATGPLSERKALDIGGQIARGLAAAHERGIIHRDIKPDNIFLTNDGRVKILDFGLAKLTQADPAGSETSLETQALHTRPDVVMGTVGYMAPEQLRGKPVDARSDIFSFGAVLYEMLSGQRAFAGDSGADVMSAILNKEPAEFSQERTSVSPALDHIVRRCLEKDPQQRFQSAGDLAFALQETSGIRTSSGSGMMAKPELSKQRPAWLVPAAAIALLLAAIAATWHIAAARNHYEAAKFTQVTFQQGFVRSARFLHDGTTIVSASRWGSESDFGLHVGSMDTVGVRSLDTPAEEIASVSVNDEILVIRDKHAVGPGYVAIGTLAEMHYGGGAPKPLMENIQYADWDPQGQKFAIVRFVAEVHRYRLEYPVGTVLYETEGWVSHPRFSRDGKTIAFLDHPIFGDDQGNVATVDLQGHVKKWAGSMASAQGLAWSPDGEEIFFSASRSGVARSLWAASLNGKERMLMNAPGTLDIQDSLPNGRVLVSDLSERRVQMLVTPQFPGPRDFTWMDWAYGQRFSRDGTQLLFGDQHSGDLYGSFLRNVDGSPAVRVGDGDPMDISPDGKYVVSRLPIAPYQLELLPIGTGEARQLTHEKIQFQTARWLDNQTIIATANYPGHPFRSFAVDLNGNVKPFTEEGVRAVAFTADGKRMLLLKTVSGKREYDVMPVGGGATTPVAGIEQSDSAMDFNNEGTAVYIQGGGGLGRDSGTPIAPNTLLLSQVDIATGKRALLFTIQAPGIPANTAGLGATISRDGKSYAYQYHPALSTEYVVEGLR